MTAPSQTSEIAAPVATAAQFVPALRTAAAAGLVAFGLSFPIISYHAESNINNELVLTGRWPLSFAIAAIVFVFVFLRQMARADWRIWFDRIGSVAAGGMGGALAQAAREGEGTAPPSAARLAFGRYVGPFMLGLVILFPLIALGLLGPQGSLKWINNYGVQILIYVMLGWGLNIVVGLAGLLDLGYVAFYAVGAYSYALLSTIFGLSFWICLPLAGMLAAMWGVILGFPVLRLRGDYLAIVTLAFGEIIRMVLINWVDLTNGYAGISEIPHVSFFGIPFTDDDDGFAAIFHLPYTPIYRTIFLFYLILALALLTNFVTIRLRRLPIGRAWEALREDEIACRSLGINTTNTKLTAFALGAMFGGFAGSFFAVRQGFVSPESFTFIESATILAIVVLGGMGSQLGVAIAAAVMIGVPELMRELDWMKSDLRRELRSDPVPHAAVRRGDGHHDDLEAAGSRFDAHAVRLPERAKGRVRRSRQRGTRLMNWLTGPLLAVENLTMRFGGLVAVNAFSFSVGRGDITALIGPNGAGKTTVFNCVTGFYKPTEGRLALARDGVATPDDIAAVTRSSGRHATTANGELFLLERMPDHEIARKARVARTFQNIRLFQGMTTLENLLVAHHNPLMLASGLTVLGLIGAPSYRRKEAESDRAGEILARQDRAHRPGRRPGGRTALRRPAPARNRARDVHRSGAALPRRAGRRTQPAQIGGAQRASAVDPRRPQDVGAPDRARHVGRHADLRSRGGARLWGEDRRRHAGGSARRSEGDRRLSRRRGRGGSRADRKGAGAMSVAAAALTPLLQLRGIETFYGKIQALRGRRHRRQQGRNRHPDRRQRGRQIDDDDDDFRRAAGAPRPDHVRRPRHHQLADAHDCAPLDRPVA